MRFPTRSFPFLAALLLLHTVPSARAEGVRLVSTDRRGVSLEVEVPSFTLEPAKNERARVVVPGMDLASVPGRPELPCATALIAIPPGARVSARVVGGAAEEVREGVRIVLGTRSTLRKDGGAIGVIPAIEAVPPILDGSWPSATVEVGEPFTIRRQHVVAVRVYPFRYDEATGRLWSRRDLEIRVDFLGGAGAPDASSGPDDDGHFEPVFETTLLNYEQGRRLRAPRPAETEGGSLFRGSLFDHAPGRPGVAAGSAFDEDDIEVRVKLDSTGVYALEYDALALHGYPANIRIEAVSVHRHEFLQDSIRPYRTVELPIDVIDADGNGEFNSGDRILLWIQNWAERSRASTAQRYWGNAEVVYATFLRGRNGLRIPPATGSFGAPLPPLASYPWTQRWEQNLTFMNSFQPEVTDTNSDQFHWTDIARYTLRDVFPFEVNDIDTTHSLRFTIDWYGRKANEHTTWAQIQNGLGLRTSVVDSMYWFGRPERIQSIDLHGSAVTEGAGNTLVQWARTQPAFDPNDDVANTAVNWFEATYWRRFQSLFGYVSLNSADAVGDYQIHVGGFYTRDIHVYDVTDSTAPQRLQLADSLISNDGQPYSVRFQGRSPGGARRSYVAFEFPKAVPDDRYTTVTRRHLAERTSGTYLLIVPEVLQNAIAPLAALRDSQGLDVVVAPLESVNDEFNGGRHSSYSIKRFIRYAYRRWNAQFVMLVGDGTEDPQHSVPGTNGVGSTDAGPEFIPVQKIPAPVWVQDDAGNTQEAIASDPWYVWCVDCPNPARQPGVHDLFIGRLPVNSVAQATDLVDKIVTYDQVTPDQTWRREMALVADDDFSTGFFGGVTGEEGYCEFGGEEVFLAINNEVRRVILNEAGLTRSNAEVFDLGAYLSGELRDPAHPNCRLSLPVTRQHTRATVWPRLYDRLNAGRLWFNFQGHANPYVLTHEDLYKNQGPDQSRNDLHNDRKPFFFSAFSCHANQFDFFRELNTNLGPSIGENMLNWGKAGAIASWASTGFELLPHVASIHINVRLARAMFANPPRDPALGDKGARVVLGEVIAKALVDNYPGLGDGERNVGLSYNLLGDPATRMSIGAPQIMVKANGVDVVSGDPVRLYTFGDTLRLEADLVSNASLKSITLERIGGAGTRIIPPEDYTVTPAFPDTIGGGRRYHLSFRTTLDIGSYKYVLRSVDRYGVEAAFEVVFRFIAVLSANGVPLADGDAVSPSADLKLLVVSPGPIANENTDFVLTLNGAPQPFTAAPAASDTSRREWVLSLSHPPLPRGDYVLRLTVLGIETAVIRFRVDEHTGLENVFAFPNPFEDDLGLQFSFNLVGDGPADVMVRVFTTSGRLVYSRSEQSLFPGNHQISWDGRDAEGSKLANGIYFYRLLAHNGSGSAMHEGRLVKLRKPRRRDIVGTP